MLNRSTLMRAAWARYRREPKLRLLPFHEGFGLALRRQWAEAKTIGDRRALMVATWARYRVVAAEMQATRFEPRLFGRVLRFAWINAKADRNRLMARIVVPAAPKALSPMEEELDALKYLPAHMSYTRHAAEIRARYEAAAHA